VSPAPAGPATREPIRAVPLLDAAAARRGDHAAVAAGDSWQALMSRAAGHLARGVLELADRAYGLRVAILVGKGDNGGDGWTAAPRLRDAGAQVWVVAVDGTDVEVSPATGAGRAAWLRSRGRTSVGTADLAAVLAWCDVAVDCLLGTGATGAPRGPAGEAAAALRAAHARGTPVVACDVPSGVSADDGAAGPGAVRADLTVTFGARKRGLLLHPGATHVGRLVVGDLGDRYEPGPGAWQALTAAGAAPAHLAPDADKRARGVILVVAGAVGTSGAAALAASGALRAGAGLVTVAVPEPVRAEVAARTDAGVMVRGLPAAAGEVAGTDGLPDLGGVDAVVAGPGLGHGDGAGEVVARLRATAPRLVLDADGLNVHRDRPEELVEHVGELVLTPHERELARIGGGEDGPDAWAHRVARVPELAARYRATIVAKGPGTLVAAPDGRVWVCPEGGPALGSGGTGDVLAGIIGAAIARADDVPLATAQAVWWHAVTGQRVGRSRAGRATATDLLGALPRVLGDLVDGRPVP
jgi:ADP-dependent NAD(P)H-hydrate dehydratase / NAD(P)H-hydrate epimerase